MRLYSFAFPLLFLLVSVVQAQQPTPTLPIEGPQHAATAQQGEEVGDGEILRIKASLVSVPVSVIDRQGKYIVDLERRDFRIYEDGVEQSIAHFTNVDQPE